MKATKKLWSVFLAAALVCSFAVPAVAATTNQEEELVFEGITAEVSVVNKYVGEAQASITPVSGDGGSALLEEFKTQAHYTPAETMIEMGSFEAIPVSLIKPTSETELTLGFSTNYGLGQFVIIANPNPVTSPIAPEELSPEGAASLAADTDSSTATPAPQTSGSGFSVPLLFIVLAVLVAAAALFFILMAARKRTDRKDDN